MRKRLPPAGAFCAPMLPPLRSTRSARDGEAKPGTAHGPRTAFFNAEEAFEDAV